MDISDTLIPKSDQLDAIELISGPRTFTITKVTKGNSEQPVSVHLAEFPRVWRPSKGMRRVLARFWTTDSTVWIGRRVTLYYDGTVKFGSDIVGGTRIAAMSDIGDKAQTITIPIAKAKSVTVTIQPLTDSPAPTADPNATRVALLRAEWKTADSERKAAIEAEVNALQGADS